VGRIGTRRTLHSSHPVHQLLHNHFASTLAINQRARDFLIPVIIDTVTSSGMRGAIELGAKAYAAWNFTEAFPKTRLIKRGMWDPSKPLNNQPVLKYDYREFAILHWDALEAFVKKFVQIYYDKNHPIVDDYEIQNWAKEITTAGKMRGFPDKIKNNEQLVDVLTMIIFTCSIQHAAVNFQQYNYLGWVPNLPLAIYRDSYPKSKKEITMKDVVEALPSIGKSATQMAAVRTLNPAVYEKSSMMHIASWIDGRVEKARLEYVFELEKLQGYVITQNAGRTDLTEYVILDPAKIPQSISI